MTFRYGKLRDSIIKAVKDGCEGKDVGVAFSGGLDSGLVSALAGDYADSVTLYTCGTDTSYDTLMAEELAEELGLPWIHVKISEDNVESLIREMIEHFEISDPFTITYELQLYSVCRTAKEKTILSGQGCDEFFIGCAKYVDCPDPEYSLLVRDGVDRLLNVSVPCEKKIVSHFGQEIVYPYLNTGVLAELNQIDPSELRPKDMDSRKTVLKEIAADLGFDTIAGRKKKSSQYGSGTTDIIRALAKAENMYFNQYVMSLYDDVMNDKS